MVRSWFLGSSGNELLVKATLGEFYSSGGCRKSWCMGRARNPSCYRTVLCAPWRCWFLEERYGAFVLCGRFRKSMGFCWSEVRTSSGSIYEVDVACGLAVGLYKVTLLLGPMSLVYVFFMVFFTSRVIRVWVNSSLEVFLFLVTCVLMLVCFVKCCCSLGRFLTCGDVRGCLLVGDNCGGVAVGGSLGSVLNV